MLERHSESLNYYAAIIHAKRALNLLDVAVTLLLVGKTSYQRNKQNQNLWPVKEVLWDPQLIVIRSSCCLQSQETEAFSKRNRSVFEMRNCPQSPTTRWGSTLDQAPWLVIIDHFPAIKERVLNSLASFLRSSNPRKHNEIQSSYFLRNEPNFINNSVNLLVQYE